MSNGTKPINLFVSSAQATYTLLLRPADIPADTIVIRDRTTRSSSPRAPGAPEGPAPSHLRSMKALLVAMAGDRVPPDIRVEEVGRPVQLWAEARLFLARRFEGRDLVGEKYLLQNVSSQPSRISLDRAFNLASHIDGIWLARAPAFTVSRCTQCGCDHLAAIGTPLLTHAECPF